ncbi:unnamed protein product [Ambrosiozyma monospora]|uniref:Unnamed protein product n=1 Tax=Ambrosiozyma monospora TaxID=43982 RepID=A0ACB5TRY5_AMBMO|nr:unnamed protein product [Ambrosiozyma monospora]
MQETNLFSPNDLKPIKERLDEIEKIIRNDNSSDEEHKLLELKLRVCYKEYETLAKKVDDLPDDVVRVMNKLLKIKSELLTLITNKETNNKEELQLLNKDLETVQKHCEGLFSNVQDGPGEGVIKGLIDECHNLIQDIRLGSTTVDPQLKEIYDKLQTLKATLKGLLVTRRWTLRTTDIFNYQRELTEIDNARVNGYFINKDYKGQSVLLHLLRRCYAIIYTLLESSEPVSESLQPLHNQLNTVRKCLLDLKRMGGITSIRELYPYQLKLASIDNQKVDGKFIINGQIPEGQGTVFALLAECFDIVHELKMELYEKEDVEDVDVEKSRNKSSVIGTKALQDTNYNYNIVDEHGYDEAEDNLASLSVNDSDEFTDA